jgi:hypothetical protein
MRNETLTRLLQLAGILHVGLIAAGLAMPRAVNLRLQIASLAPFVRQLFWVYYAFIGLCLVSFGFISFAFASLLASGEPLSRALCLFLTAFWTLRLIAATFIFDVSPYVTTPALKLGYHATNIVFVFLPIVYFLAALK